MQESNCKIRVRIGQQIEVEVAGSTKSETMALFEEVLNGIREGEGPGGAKMFPWKSGSKVH